MNAGNKWICKTCGGSVPRQNGKTGLMQGRAEAGMLLYGEKVLYTAHLQKTSTETFEEMASFFDSSAVRKYVKDIKTAIGREQILLQNGGRIKFLARTRNGGRGQHGDLLILMRLRSLIQISRHHSFRQYRQALIHRPYIWVHLLIRQHREKYSEE